MQLKPYAVNQYIEPSLYSLSGRCLDNIKNDVRANLHHPSCLEAIAVTIARIWYAFCVIIAAGIDLLAWTLMTIHFKSMCRIGMKTHLTNLISTLAAPLLALTILFGYIPRITSKRAFLVLPTNAIAFDAARGNRRALEKLKPQINHPDRNGFTPLMHASSTPDSSRGISNLIACGANPNLASQDQETPLLIAMSNRLETNVDSLLQNDADANLSTPQRVLRLGGQKLESIPMRPLEFLLWNLSTQNVLLNDSALHDHDYQPIPRDLDSLNKSVQQIARSLICAGAIWDRSVFEILHKSIEAYPKERSEFPHQLREYLEKNPRKDLHAYPPLQHYGARSQDLERLNDLEPIIGYQLFGGIPPLQAFSYQVFSDNIEIWKKQSEFINSISDDLDITREAYYVKKVQILLSTTPLANPICGIVSHYWTPYMQLEQVISSF